MMKLEDIHHLQWIYDRMVRFHDENPNVDYMRKFHSIICDLHNEDLKEDNSKEEHF